MTYGPPGRGQLDLFGGPAKEAPRVGAPPPRGRQGELFRPAEDPNAPPLFMRDEPEVTGRGYHLLTEPELKAEVDRFRNRAFVTGG